MLAPQVILITGASSGIGHACALGLASHGHRVYGTSRRADFRADQFNVIRMDVTDDASVRSGVEEVVGREGRLDVLVNNAGIGIAGAIENSSIEETTLQFNTNFFGALRVCRAALPAMRERRHGLILNVSSLAGRIPLPFQGIYSASKFALEGMSEALAMEVAPFGIHVVLLQPGSFRTSFTLNRLVVNEARHNGAYQATFRSALTAIEAEERNGASPELVARLVERIVIDPSPSRRYSVGAASERAVPFLRSLIPTRLYEYLLMKHYGA